MSLFSKKAPAWKKYEAPLAAINKLRSRGSAEPGGSLAETFAAVALACERVLGQRPHDVQILGALAMADGKIAEMATGEGKTLAATMAVCYLARRHGGIHVLTANDYLARRDAGWMGGIYRALGLSVAALQQRMQPAERRQAYACDITYATANEVGFDYLRDGLALREEDLVQRPFTAALIDEADSILIDEARMPLVIAGGQAPPAALARLMAAIVARLEPFRDYTVDAHGRNACLTDAGLARVEAAAGGPDLYHPDSGPLLEALENALHAHALLRRDVDYVVRQGRIELVDEFKGRIAENRRWPAGLQTALEAKEGIDLQQQGRVLGSITLQNLVALYPTLCGMTGTAATQARELKEFYNLDVVAIPTHRPVIRADHPDLILPTRADKERAVVEEVLALHRTGRPILAGTASVEESERLSGRLVEAGVPHEVLNARDDEREAAIVARAGALGAVTISTNMAGRGTDIPLAGEPVRALGGLYVIGTNRHEARRIDHQLRGRAGRQGDPGASRFFLSLQDDLLVRFGISDLLADHSSGEAIDTVQRLIEDENLQIRQMLWKYEYLIEGQRLKLRARRMEMLASGAPPADLARIDALWADHLARIAELRDGLCWVALGGQDPFPGFLRRACELFDELERQATQDGAAAHAEVRRGATWTYIVNDQPFGSLTDRLYAGLRQRLRAALRRASKLP